MPCNLKSWKKRYLEVMRKIKGKDWLWDIEVEKGILAVRVSLYQNQNIKISVIFIIISNTILDRFYPERKGKDEKREPVTEPNTSII